MKILRVIKRFRINMLLSSIEIFVPNITMRRYRISRGIKETSRFSNLQHYRILSNIYFLKYNFVIYLTEIC